MRENSPKTRTALEERKNRKQLLIIFKSIYLPPPWLPLNSPSGCQCSWYWGLSLSSPPPHWPPASRHPLAHANTLATPACACLLPGHCTGTTLQLLQQLPGSPSKPPSPRQCKPRGWPTTILVAIPVTPWGVPTSRFAGSSMAAL